MSRLIDERVVEMGFDNKEFESNVKTSMSTINNLKSSLDFSGVSSSMNKAFSGVNTSILAGGIQSVTQQFSAMQIAAITTISNITNRLVDLGLNMVKSLSIDNVMVGWEKYGEKTKSVGTLSAQGYDLDVINAQLEKLAWYTDETSYSFTDMVSNISKFTASGQELDKSVDAMMGIANWAALSGQNTQVASRAMYQLSQAIGAGAVRYEDWRSIQTLTMDSEEFRQKALDTAVAMGQLNRTITGEYATLSGKTFGLSQFAEYLTSDRWLTTDVLMGTLDQYSSAVDTLYEKVKITGEAATSSEAMEIFGDQLDAFGLKAFKSAQEARTLRDALNAIKEAVSSSWVQIFENIFGAYDDAKQLWTDLSYELYDIFVPGLARVNEVLKEWNVLGGRNDIFENTEESTGAFWNLFRAITDVVNVIKGAWNVIFPISKMKEESEQIKDIASKLKGLTEGIKAFAERLRMSEETSGKLSSIFQGLFSVIKFIGKAFQGLWTGVQPIVDIFKDLFKWAFDLLALGGDKFTRFVKNFTMFETIGYYMAYGLTYLIGWVKNSTLLKTAFEKIANAFNFVKSAIGSFISGMKMASEIVTYEDGYVILGNGWARGLNEFAMAGAKFSRAITSLIEKVKEFHILDRIKDSFIRLKEGIISAWTSLSAFIKKLTGLTFGDILKLIGEKLRSGFNTIKDVMSGFSSVDTEGVSTFGDSIIEKLGPLKNLFDGLVSVIKGFWNLIKAVIPIIGNLLNWFGNALSSLGDTLTKLFNGSEGLFRIETLFDIAFWSMIITYAHWLINQISLLKGEFLEVFEGLGAALESKAILQYSLAIKNIAIALMILVAALILLASVDSDRMASAILSIGALMGMIMGLMLAMKSMFSVTKGLGLRSLVAGFAMEQTASAIMYLAVSVTVLALAVKIIAGIKEEDILRSVLTLMSIISALIATSIIISKNKGSIIEGTKGLLTLSLSVLVLSVALKSISKLSMEEIWRGLIGVSALVALAMSFSLITRYVSGAIKASFGLFIFANALLVASIPLKIIGSMSWDQLAIGLAGLTGILSIMLFFASFSKYISNSIRVALALGIFSLSLLSASLALKILGSMTWDQLAVALAGITGVISLLLLTLYLSGKYVSNALLTAGSMLMLSAAMVAFSFSIVTLSLISWGGIAKAVLSLAAIVLMLFGLSKVMNIRNVSTMFIFGLALASLSTGLLAFAIALKALGSVSWGDIGMALAVIFLVIAGTSFLSGILGIISPLIALFGLSLIVLSGGLVSFAIAMKMMGSLDWAGVGKGFLIIAGALLVFYVASKFIGKSIPVMLAFSSTLLMMAVSFLLVAFGLSLIMSMVAGVSESLSASIGFIADSISETAPKVAAAIGSLIVAVSDVLIKTSDSLFAVIDNAIGGILNILIKRGPELALAGVILLDNFLAEMVFRFPSIAESLVIMLSMILDAVSEKIEDTTDRLIDIVLGIVDTLTDRLPELIRSLENFIRELVESVVDSLIRLIPDLVDAAFELVTGLIDGVGEAIEDNSGRLGESMIGFGRHMWNALINFFGGVEYDSLVEVGSNIVNKIKEGLVSAWNGVVAWFESIAKYIDDFFKKTFGVNFVMQSGSGSVLTVEDFNRKESMRMTTRVPRESAAEYGESLNEEFEESGVFSAVQKIYDMIISGISDDLVIRPVMDLTEIQNGTRIMHGMLEEFDGYSIKASSTASMADKTYKGMREREISRASGRTSDKNLVNPNQNPQENTVINNTFNISGANPKEIANEVSRELGKQIERRNAKWALGR